MSFFRLTGLALFFAFVLGCMPPAPQTATPNVRGGDRTPRNPPRTEREYDDRKDRDKDRDSVLNSSRKRHRGPKCEDEDRDHDCRDQCKDIYSGRDRKDCEELAVTQIENLHDLHEKLLEDPDDRSLAEVDTNDWDVYLNISIKPLDKLISKYSTRETKEFLLWLIREEDIAQKFIKEDDDYRSFKELLENLASAGDTNDNIYKYFIANVDGSDTLMEVAATDGDEEIIIKWFLDFINEENDDCERDETSDDCWEIYCKIGDEMDEDSRIELLSSEEFEDYVEDIIDEGTNGTIATSSAPGDEWCQEGSTHADCDGSPKGIIENVRDIDDWYDDLCGGLA